MTKCIVRTSAWKTDVNFFIAITNCQIVRSRSLTHRINYNCMCLSVKTTSHSTIEGLGFHYRHAASSQFKLSVSREDQKCVLAKVTLEWFETFSLNFSISLFLILVPLWFIIIISLVFFYLVKYFFSGFLQFNGN